MGSRARHRQFRRNARRDAGRSPMGRIAYTSRRLAGGCGIASSRCLSESGGERPPTSGLECVAGRTRGADRSRRAGPSGRPSGGPTTTSQRRSSRWARCTAARCRGLLRLAHGDDTGAVVGAGALARGGGWDLPAGTRPVARLRSGRCTATRAAAGRRARPSSVRSRSWTRWARRPWRDQARDEPSASSGRRVRTDDGLTDSEQRVAELAAQGRKNKEIAATLFLAVGTVEMHLSRVYRKLGVRSRTELAGHVNDRPTRSKDHGFPFPLSRRGHSVAPSSIEEGPMATSSRPHRRGDRPRSPASGSSRRSPRR